MQSGTQGSLGGGSLPLRTAQVSFDVTKESEVIALLKYIHQNPIDPDAKNSLRDAVFVYRQDLGQTTFAVLQSACAAIGVTLSSSTSSTGVKPVVTQTSTRVNAGRPLPSFKASAMAPAPQTHGATAAQPSATAEAGVSSVPLRKIVVPKFEVVAKPLPVVTPQPVVAEPAVVPSATPVAVPPTPIVDIAAAQARISEIKHAVNAKVGNPVNLIDAHNEVGRLYMNSLLDAMKKANGGVQGELAVAMSTLEDAYAQVLKALEGAPVALQPQPQNTVEAEVVKPVEARVASTPESTAAFANAPLVSSATRVPIVSEEQRVKEITEKLNALRNQVASGSAQKQAPTPQPTPTIPTALIPTYTQQERVQAVVKQAVPTKETAQGGEGIHSVAKNKQLQDLLRSNREKEIAVSETKEQEAIAKMDKTETPEVSAGLAQLLSEWSLFRSSGFFGTGPSGKDHVLYQKLAPLTMASVIAGRFEGATPLIKQSIADYMNGWRYEEGIVHEHGETFEHYLRKVVYHIIEKKKSALIRKS